MTGSRGGIPPELQPLQVRLVGSRAEREEVFELRDRVFRSAGVVTRRADYVDSTARFLDPTDGDLGTVHGVAVAGSGRIVASGRLVVNPLHERTFAIHNMVTDPLYARRGIGSLLLNLLEDEAASAPAHIMTRSIGRAPENLRGSEPVPRDAVRVTLDAVPNAAPFYWGQGYKFTKQPPGLSTRLIPMHKMLQR